MDKELGEEIRFRKALAYKQLAFTEEVPEKKKELLEKCEFVFESEDRFKSVFSIIKTYYLENDVNKKISDIKEMVIEVLKKIGNPPLTSLLEKAGTVPDYIIPQFLLMMVIKDSKDNEDIEIKKILFKNLKDAIKNLLPSFSGNSNVLASWHYALGILYDCESNNGKALEHFKHAHSYADHAEQYGVKKMFDSVGFGEIKINTFITEYVEPKIKPNGVK